VVIFHQQDLLHGKPLFILMTQAYLISQRGRVHILFKFHQQGQHFIVRGMREHIEKLNAFDAIARQMSNIFAMVWALQLE
jgi:hypothetical protein